MDINVLKNFLVLAETLHFTKSSDKAFIAQPALSRQIKQLEESLNAQLFKRDRRNVELTPAGKYFKAEMERLVNQFDHAAKRTAQLHQGEAGEIRIGYTYSVMQSFLPGMIRHINEILPDIHTVLLEINNKQQAIDLKNKEIDIGFSTNPVISDDLKSKVLLRDNFAVVLPLDHPVSAENFEDLSIFANDRFILPPRSEGSLYVGTVESIFIEAGFLPNIVHKTPFASTGIRLVEAGLGITVEPMSSLRNYPGIIKYIELKDTIQKAELTMLWHPELETDMPRVIDLLMNFGI